MPEDNKLNDDDKNPKKGGEFKVPPRTWIVWIGIFGVIILLMLMRDRWQTESENLPQWRFQELVDSNLIAQASVNYSPQNPLLTEIIGKYNQLDKDGKLITGDDGRAKAFPFRTRARLSQTTEEELFRKKQFEPREPNTMLLSVVWSVLPIIIIAALIWFFFIRQIKMAGKGALSFGKSKARLLAKPPEIVAGPETMLKVTGRPEEAVALTANGASP